MAKAVRDSVIDATIAHSEQTLQSKETADIYATTEPTEAFDSRISFCLTLYNQCVKVGRVRVYVCMYVCMYVRTYVRICMHAYIYIYGRL